MRLPESHVWPHALYMGGGILLSSLLFLYARHDEPLATWLMRFGSPGVPRRAVPIISVAVALGVFSGLVLLFRALRRLPKHVFAAATVGWSCLLTLVLLVLSQVPASSATSAVYVVAYAVVTFAAFAAHHVALPALRNEPREARVKAVGTVAKFGFGLAALVVGTFAAAILADFDSTESGILPPDEEEERQQKASELKSRQLDRQIVSIAYLAAGFLLLLAPPLLAEALRTGDVAAVMDEVA